MSESLFDKYGGVETLTPLVRDFEVEELDIIEIIDKAKSLKKQIVS